jgi:hypothetical protein
MLLSASNFMEERHLVKVFILLLALVSYPAFAEVKYHSGQVTAVEVFQDHWSGGYNENQPAMLALYIEGLPPACGSHRRTVIRTTHPLYDSVLSIALSAQTTGRPVKLAYLDRCTVRTGAWDFGYLHIEP